MELPLAPRWPEKLFTPRDRPNFASDLTLEGKSGLSTRCDPSTRKARHTGMPPSVASQTLTNGVGRAMTKHHSHSFPEHFSTECCAKNTQSRMARPRPQNSHQSRSLRLIFSCKFKMIRKTAGATDAQTKPAAATSYHYIRSKTDEFSPISTPPSGRKAHFRGNRSPRPKLFISHRVPGSRHERFAALAAAGHEPSRNGRQKCGEAPQRDTGRRRRSN